MRQSTMATFDAFKRRFLEHMADAENADEHHLACANLRHYYRAALGWSDSKNEKRVNWFATICGFLRSDYVAGKLVRDPAYVPPPGLFSTPPPPASPSSKADARLAQAARVLGPRPDNE